LPERSQGVVMQSAVRGGAGKTAGPSSERKRMLRKRERILQEIVETEIVYYRNLLGLVQMVKSMGGGFNCTHLYAEHLHSNRFRANENWERVAAFLMRRLEILISCNVIGLLPFSIERKLVYRQRTKTIFGNLEQICALSGVMLSALE